jgi:tRNA G18 (ribose-2'-O)-methylase SpoU
MGKAESLNAGVATGIILHEMVKKLTFESKWKCPNFWS